MLVPERNNSYLQTRRWSVSSRLSPPEQYNAKHSYFKIRERRYFLTKNFSLEFDHLHRESGLNT